MQLSNKAINDLRKELLKVYGSDFGLTDEQLNEIGEFLLTGLAEGLKQMSREMKGDQKRKMQKIDVLCVNYLIHFLECHPKLGASV